MYQAGACDTGCRRQALMNGESDGWLFTPPIVSHAQMTRRSRSTECGPVRVSIDKWEPIGPASP